MRLWVASTRLGGTGGGRARGRSVCWHSVTPALLMTLALCLSACATSAPATGIATNPGQVSGANSSTVVRAVATGGAAHVTVLVEPDAGVTPITQAIEGAQRSVWVEVYLLTDSAVIHALDDAANRGVDVRVLLELNPYGSGATSPALTMEELQAAGVRVEGANPAFHYTHEKAMIVDNSTLWVMTANLTKSALGGSSGAVNREYLVTDTAPADVAEAAAIFTCDWQRTSPSLTDPSLVVSPVNARSAIGSLISSARSKLMVEDEEMYDPSSEDELIAAARRGVSVEVVMPQPSGGTSTDVQRLASGGVQVRYSNNLYMHAKMLVADGQEGFVGSENFSATSLDENRELGLLISDPTAIATLNQTFATDWASGENAG